MTTNVEGTNVKQTTNNGLVRLIQVTGISILAATAANLGLYYAAGILFPEVTAWAGSGAGQIAGANMAYLTIAAVLFAVVRRFSNSPKRHYLILATIALVVSLGLPISAGFGYGPPGVPPAGAASVITLSLMHLVSYAISVPLFIRTILD